MTAHYLSVNQALRLAKTHTNRGALSEAKRAYRWILDKIPDHGRALEGLRALQGPTAEPVLPQPANTPMELFRQGKLEEAHEKAAALVAQSPRSGELHNLVGSIEAALGQSLRAIGSFRRAAALRPDLLEARLNLGRTLGEIGRHRDAIATLEQTVEENPECAEAHDLIGLALQETGRHNDAIDSHKRATKLNPSFTEAFIHLGHALIVLNDLQEATRNFAKAAKIDPNSWEAHSALGAALTEMGRPEDGIRACRRAIDLSPGSAQAHVDLAAAQDGLDDIDGALASLERAVALQADHAGAHSAICRIHAQAKHRDLLSEALKRARAACGEDDPLIRFWIAELQETEGTPQSARRILEEIPETGMTPVAQASRLKLIGKIDDGLGNFAGAFESARQANETLKATPVAQKLNPGSYLREIEELTASFTGVHAKPWTDPAETHNWTPVFLVGFPGGCDSYAHTLLAEHPAVTVIEDKPMVARMRALLGGPADIERLEALTEDDIAAMQRAYFTELFHHAGGRTASGGVIVDKMPLNIVHAGLISRVFPTAKFLFSAHHPCNSVLGCYMRDYRLDNATANFLDLEVTATLYDRAMRLWAAYRNLLGLNVHLLSCETSVLDRRESVRSLLGYLGLDPAYLLRDNDSASPDHWENYREQLEPVLPLLESWARNSGH